MKWGQRYNERPCALVFLYATHKRQKKNPKGASKKNWGHRKTTLEK